jgi:hypothetical protein
LPALSLDGYICWKIYQDSFTIETFNAFIEVDLLPHMNAYPAPRSVLVMDNHSIHHSDVRFDRITRSFTDSNSIYLISAQAAGYMSSSCLRTHQTSIRSNNHSHSLRPGCGRIQGSLPSSTVTLNHFYKLQCAESSRARPHAVISGLAAMGRKRSIGPAAVARRAIIAVAQIATIAVD